jgi:hypothetical protein
VRSIDRFAPNDKSNGVQPKREPLDATEKVELGSSTYFRLSALDLAPTPRSIAASPMQAKLRASSGSVAIRPKTWRVAGQETSLPAYLAFVARRRDGGRKNAALSARLEYYP